LSRSRRSRSPTDEHPRNSDDWHLSGPGNFAGVDWDRSRQLWRACDDLGTRQLEKPVDTKELRSSVMSVVTSASGRFARASEVRSPTSPDPIPSEIASSHAAHRRLPAGRG
jgi:hypothetical protein